MITLSHLHNVTNTIISKPYNSSQPLYSPTGQNIDLNSVLRKYTTKTVNVLYSPFVSYLFIVYCSCTCDVETLINNKFQNNQKQTQNTEHVFLHGVDFHGHLIIKLMSVVIIKNSYQVVQSVQVAP